MFKKQEQKGEINSNNIFYLIQYMQNFILIWYH